MNHPPQHPGIVRNLVVTDKVTLRPGDRVGVAPWYTPGRVELRTGTDFVVTNLRDVRVGILLEGGFIGYFCDPQIAVYREWGDEPVAEGAWVGGDSIILRNGSEITPEIGTALAELERRIPDMLKAFSVAGRSPEITVSPAMP